MVAEKGMVMLSAEELVQMIRDERREAVLIVMGEIGEEKPMTRSEVKIFLGKEGRPLSEETLRKYIKQESNPLPYGGKGKMTYFYKNEIREWLSRQKDE
ncbi:MAG: hypothetical protein H7282_04820 [Cytophagaceae bacterium]|nr:hypothetical protein [Cytophagaceae bacterium]